MIVLTEIKLHQSAMRDIILLGDHAVIKKKKQITKEVMNERTQPLTCFKKVFMSSVRGGYRVRCGAAWWRNRQ